VDVICALIERRYRERVECVAKTTTRLQREVEQSGLRVLSRGIDRPRFTAPRQIVSTRGMAAGSLTKTSLWSRRDAAASPVCQRKFGSDLLGCDVGGARDDRINETISDTATRNQDLISLGITNDILDGTGRLSRFERG